MKTEACFLAVCMAIALSSCGCNYPQVVVRTDQEAWDYYRKNEPDLVKWGAYRKTWEKKYYRERFVAVTINYGNGNILKCYGMTYPEKFGKSSDGKHLLIRIATVVRGPHVVSLFCDGYERLPGSFSFGKRYPQAIVMYDHGYPRILLAKCVLPGDGFQPLVTVFGKTSWPLVCARVSADYDKEEVGPRLCPNWGRPREMVLSKQTDRQLRVSHDNEDVETQWVPCHILISEDFRIQVSGVPKFVEFRSANLEVIAVTPENPIRDEK